MSSNKNVITFVVLTILLYNTVNIVFSNILDDSLPPDFSALNRTINFLNETIDIPNGLPQSILNRVRDFLHFYENRSLGLFRRIENCHNYDEKCYSILSELQRCFARLCSQIIFFVAYNRN